MEQAFTVYVGAGAVAGLAVFLLLFLKWKLPGKFKKMFRLNTRLKMFVFIILLGVVLTAVTTILSVVFGLAPEVTETIQGVGIGFSCAVVVGLVSVEPNANQAAQAKQAGKRRSADNRGRRSKG